MVNLFLGDFRLANGMIFCDKGDVYLDPTEVMLGSMLRQLCDRERTAFWSKLNEAFHNRTSKTLGDKSAIIRDLLALAITHYDTIYLIADGIDHLPEQCRDDLYEEIMRLPSDKLSVMITSRQISALSADTVDCSVEDCAEPVDVRLWWHCDACEEEDFDVCQVCFELGLTCGKEYVEPSYLDLSRMC